LNLARYLQVLVAGLILVLLVACAAPRTSGETIVSPLLFPVPQSEFLLWREQVKSHVVSLSLPHRSAVEIELNLPFALDAAADVPYRGKFLLIHGLNDSLCVCLAGYGGCYRENGLRRACHTVARTRVSSASDAGGQLPAMAKCCARALSTMGYQGRPDFCWWFFYGRRFGDHSGFLVSPAYRSQLNSYLRWAWLYKHFKPWLFGGMIGEDNPGKYNSIPINSAHQYYRTTRYLERRWNNKLAMPILLTVSTEDSVVDAQDVRQKFKHRFSADRRILVTYSAEPSTSPLPQESIRSSYYPELRILSQSHLSLINSPDNPLLGRNGSLLICNGNDPQTFFGCLRATGHWYGAQHAVSPDQNKVARSTYNPDFDNLLESFKAAFH